MWRGLLPTLIAAVPMVGIYMPLYDTLRDRFEPALAGTAPLVASSLARAVAVVSVAPLEVLRTRLMSSKGDEAARRGRMCWECRQAAEAQAAPLSIRRPLSGGWWRGLNATVRAISDLELHVRACSSASPWLHVCSSLSSVHAALHAIRSCDTGNTVLEADTRLSDD